MRFLHMADVHIGTYMSGSHLGELAKIRRQEIKETFYRALRFAQEERLDFLFIAGDLIEEKSITLSDMNEISEQLGRLTATQVVMIAGNHDPLTEQSVYHWVKWPENVHILDTKLQVISFDGLQVDVYGLSWSTKAEDKPLFDEVEIKDRSRINILLAHGDCQTNSHYLPLNKNKLLEKGFDYIALGHIHKHQFLEENMAYSGSLEPLDFSEQGVHGFILGTIESHKRRFDFIPFAKRAYQSLEVEVAEEDTIVGIKEKIKTVLLEGKVEDFYRIYLKGYREAMLHIEPSFLVKDFQDDGFMIQIFDRTKPSYDLDRMMRENEGTMVGRYIAELLEASEEDDVIKEALYLGLEALLAEKVKAC